MLCSRAESALWAQVFDFGNIVGHGERDARIHGSPNMFFHYEAFLVLISHAVAHLPLLKDVTALAICWILFTRSYPRLSLACPPTPIFARE